MSCICFVFFQSIFFFIIIILHHTYWFQWKSHLWSVELQHKAWPGSNTFQQVQPNHVKSFPKQLNAWSGHAKLCARALPVMRFPLESNIMKPDNRLLHEKLHWKKWWVPMIWWVLRQTWVEQQGSEGLVWLTMMKPGPLHFSTGGAGHTLGLQVTALVDSSQMQSWQLYSKLSSNWNKEPESWLDSLNVNTDITQVVGILMFLE